MKYIYSIKYKDRTRYRIIVSTTGHKKIHLGYANTLEEAIQRRNHFLGATGKEIITRLNMVEGVLNTCLKRYDFLLKEKQYQEIQNALSKLKQVKQQQLKSI